ncbi:hypothetical protein PM082_014348 [Marasmius tenuissimus]|nr:hypothetical protein PM082_014348 [Marasmius tenuissimus]
MVDCPSTRLGIFRDVFYATRTSTDAITVVDRPLRRSRHANMPHLRKVLQGRRKPHDASEEGLRPGLIR